MVRTYEQNGLLGRLGVENIGPELPDMLRANLLDANMPFHNGGRLGLSQ